MHQAYDWQCLQWKKPFHCLAHTAIAIPHTEGDQTVLRLSGAISAQASHQSLHISENENLTSTDSNVIEEGIDQSTSIVTSEETSSLIQVTGEASQAPQTKLPKSDSGEM